MVDPGLAGNQARRRVRFLHRSGRWSPPAHRLVLTCLALVCTGLAQAQETGLAKVRERGVLEVALYESFPPFSDREDGKTRGIDVDIARAIAAKLGVNAAIRLVAPDETMEDDLRIYIWKGHYLNSSVADVMLHVPYDREFSADNDRVAFIAPYYQEQIVVALDPKFGAKADALDVFTREKVGVELDTLADFYLLSADNGRIRENVVHFRSVGEAGAALRRGELAGVMAPRGELEAALAADREDYRIGVIQLPGLRRSVWDVGAAVKHGNEDLARAIDQAMAELHDSGELARIFARYGVSYQRPSEIRRVAR